MSRPRQQASACTIYRPDASGRLVAVDAPHPDQAKAPVPAERVIGALHDAEAKARAKAEAMAERKADILAERQAGIY